MKKLLITLFICSPFLLIGQSKGEFTLKLNEGLVYDSKHTKNDVFEHTSDVYTRHDGTGKAKNGIQLSTGYSLRDNLLVGLSFMSSKIEASNDVEYVQGKFTETSMFAEYKVLDASGFGLFTKAGFGGIFYDTKRYLEADGGSVGTVNELGDDKSDGTASKLMYGLGISYNVYDAINLSFEVTRNVVYDDGFDGWNEDEWRSEKGTDRYVYASIGISYTFATKKKGNVTPKPSSKREPIVRPVIKETVKEEKVIEEKATPATPAEEGGDAAPATPAEEDK